MNYAKRFGVVGQIRLLRTTGTFDLVEFNGKIRRIFPCFDEFVAAEAALVAVILASRAFHHRPPPLTLCLWHDVLKARLRLELPDYTSCWRNQYTHDYGARLLDQITPRHGLTQSAVGITAWAELSVTPHQAAGYS